LSIQQSTWFSKLRKLFLLNPKNKPFHYQSYSFLSPSLPLFSLSLSPFFQLPWNLAHHYSSFRFPIVTTQYFYLAQLSSFSDSISHLLCFLILLCASSSASRLTLHTSCAYPANQFDSIPTIHCIISPAISIWLSASQLHSKLFQRSLASNALGLMHSLHVTSQLSLSSSRENNNKQIIHYYPRTFSVLPEYHWELMLIDQSHKLYSLNPSLMLSAILSLLQVIDPYTPASSWVLSSHSSAYCSPVTTSHSHHHASEMIPHNDF